MNLRLLAVAVLALQVTVGDERMTHITASRVHAGQEGRRWVVGAAAEAGLAAHHHPSSSTGHEGMTLGAVARHPLQCGLVLRRHVRRDIHATGQTVSGQGGGAVVGSRLCFRDLRLHTVGECHLACIG